jgi:protease-4
MLVSAAALAAVSCGGLKIRLGTPPEEPLKEFTVEGKERGKVLVIPVTGFLSDAPGKGLLERRPSMVQEVVSQLRRAEKDGEIRAVVLEINSPGGSITASDILYRELMDFKEHTKVPMVAALMDVAASGAYYLALSADRIVAHPTTITGSVGVILVKPKVMGLMEKLGLAVEVDKSGREKDIGSPFRASTTEEQKIFRDLVAQLGGRFLSLVATRRKISSEDLQKISSARIYLAQEALHLKLIDDIGYLKDAVAEAKRLAALPKDAKVVVYRRTTFPNDNLYNTSAASYLGPAPSLIDLNLPEIMPPLTPGFYYLWLPGTGDN